MAYKYQFAASAVVAFVLLSTVTACAAPDLTDYSSVRARLDPETHTIVMPLDAYSVEGRDIFLMDHANNLLIGDCMAESGLDYPRVAEDWQTRAVMPDRTYGLWTLTWAEEYGYEIPSDETSDEISKIEEGMPESWWEAARSCWSSYDELPVFGLFFDDEQSPADRGFLEASAYAAASEEWRSARDAWVDCLAEHGLKPFSDTSFTPELPEDAQAQGEIAVQDVKCKDEVGLVQKVADLQAKYEAAYIDAHEAELSAFGQEIDDLMAKAIEIIATHEG